ncbi:DUF6380 family protein [Streptomyces sp. NPDC001348]
MEPTGEEDPTSVARHATLRCGAASLTVTAGRASFPQYGGTAQEGAR